MKTGGVDLKTNKIPKILMFPFSAFAECRYDVTSWWGGWASPQLLNISRKIYLSGPQQVPWGLIRPSTPKSLPTPDLDGKLVMLCSRNWLVLNNIFSVNHQVSCVLVIIFEIAYWCFLVKWLNKSNSPSVQWEEHLVWKPATENSPRLTFCDLA